ncbi:MAG: phosphoadenylyl-sulfate reductase [Candidatus Omnitrophica bacterium]|nr:phosphoadenylyl-sulfate reductase [Candidatus Omnitrophota bacterium]
MTPREIARLNKRFETLHPIEIVRWAVETFRPQVALTSSFGAKSAGIIHMALQADPKIEIRVVDTGLLFKETYVFMGELKKRFHLNLKIVGTALDVPKFLREHEGQAVGHPEFCCSSYKVETTERMLKDLRCWITGISRSDATTRAATPFVEALSNGVTKVAPLAGWSSKQLHEYMTKHDLPYHPLWEKGYTSIGCWPCTQKPVDPHDPRSGRWAGQDKTECGIHNIGKKGSDPI